MKIPYSTYFGFIGMAMALGEPTPSYREPSETSEERERRLEFAKRGQNQTKGLKEFKYGINSLWALNQKSADKKATKLGWI